MVQSILGFVRKEPIRISIFILSASFMVLLTLLRPGWDPYQGRYFLPIVLLNTCYASKWINNSIPWRISSTALGIAGLLILTNGILYNPAKPIIDYPIPLFYRYPEDPGYTQIKPGKKLVNLTILKKYHCKHIVIMQNVNLLMIIFLKMLSLVLQRVKIIIKSIVSSEKIFRNQ